MVPVLGQPAHGDQCLGPDSWGSVQFAGDGPQLAGVHLGVLVLTEVVLQGFQALDELLAGPGRVDAAEALEQVAELLGVLAQLVQLLRRGLGRDRAPTGHEPGLRPRREGGGDAPDGMVGVPAGALRCRFLQPGAPASDQVAVARGPQSSGEGVVFQLALARYVVEHRLERRCPLRPQRVHVICPLDDVHVEVACPAGGGAEPPEALAVGVPDSSREDLFALGQHRAGAAHGHTQVVEELRVQVVHGALPIGLDGISQVGENPTKGLRCRLLPPQRHGGRCSEAGHVDAGVFCHQLERRDGAAEETEQAQYLHRPRRVLGVPGDRDNLGATRDGGRAPLNALG